MIESERIIFHKACFGQKKKGRTQQLRDANGKFSAAKQLYKAEVQSCVATADDESATPRTPATGPWAGRGGTGQVPRRKKGHHTRLADLTECCGTLFVLWTLLLSSCFLVVLEIDKFSS